MSLGSRQTTMLLLLRLLLLSAAEAKAEAKAAGLLDRAAALDAWWERGAPPAAWTVSRASDVGKGALQEIGAASKAKRVFRTHIGNESVVLKRASGATGGDDVYLEMVYLEALRGRPGVPRLRGAWREGDAVVYVVDDCGAEMGQTPGLKGKPVALAAAYRNRAAAAPLALARALLACFGSFASAGYVVDDFKAQQFTLDARGLIYLVDGPRLLADSALGRAVARSPKIYNARERACAVDADCPFAKEHLSCRGAGTCERGARGAPEARGKCLKGTCALLSEKTHVYDVANRPWLLPYIADRATGGDRAFLVALIRHASAEDPDDRPSFAELVGAIDRRVDGVTVN